MKNAGKENISQDYKQPFSPQEKGDSPPSDAGVQFNRLIHELSPYLLQHAENPVNWYPWGPEAFAEAESNDKPIFLSIGYSACHWCHVMERESFAREDVAEILNGHYVSIKVDREERPDIDQIYMLATQILSGSGGWPNSLWLTPDGKPWYAGTYFQREDSTDHLGLKSVLSRLAGAWRTRRNEVNAVANRITAQMEHNSSMAGLEASGGLTHELLSNATEMLSQPFDSEHGGFNGAPKFPPYGALSLLFQEYLRTKNRDFLKMTVTTLDGMALGGIRDHIGEGFHRYSLDNLWLLPHFEKMLYDNAQLAEMYVTAYRLTGNEFYKLAADGIYEWATREMLDDGGAFYSSLDAESEGEEGKFYLWRRNEILDVLGPEDGDLFCKIYGVKDNGNFQDPVSGQSEGTNILHLEKPVPFEHAKRLSFCRKKLLAARNLRVHPRRDDKVLVSWNSLMVGSLAYGGYNLGNHAYIAAAQKAADFILNHMRADGRLLRSFRNGHARLESYLDDYAFLGDALMNLHYATGKKRWLAEAERFAEYLIVHYGDPSGGGFFFTADYHEKLLLRLKDPFDSATPSGNAVAVRLFIQLAEQTGQKKYLHIAEQTLKAFLGVMEKAPTAALALLAAAGEYLDVTER